MRVIRGLLSAVHMLYGGLGEIVDLIQNCGTCAKTSRNPIEPLIPTPTPEYPWQKVASDMFEWQKNSYLLVVDYFSRFIEVVKCML